MRVRELLNCTIEAHIKATENSLQKKALLKEYNRNRLASAVHACLRYIMTTDMLSISIT